jgi:murein DD-endopeptidase MepM/ murein hydrolase activator NlpD
MKQKMNYRYIKNIIIVLFVAFFFLPVLTKGDRQEALLQKKNELQRIEKEFLEYQSRFSGDFFSTKEENIDQISEIRKKIESELQSFDESKKTSEETEQKLKTIHKQIGTLSGQMMALDISIDITKKEIDTVQQQIQERINDLKTLSNASEQIGIETEAQKKVISSFFRLLQSENEEFGVSDESRNIIRVLLSNESFSKNYWEEQQLIALGDVGRKAFYKFEKSQEELEEIKKLTSQENSRLQALYKKRKNEEQRLKRQIHSKDILRKNAQMSEKRFKELLEESKTQMHKSASIIAKLQEDKESLREKMDILEEAYQKERLQRARERKKQLIAEEERYLLGDEFLLQDRRTVPFSWPVNPKRGISAYYLDKSYEDIFHVPHHAIDIPVPQGSEIYAPAFGYVYKATDNGMGYSSLILAHRNNIMTVYGHISHFHVKEGELVKEGDTIAISGGMPGTKGAGFMTTGPHLHFEVFQDGKHVDPLNYLPLIELPKVYIPKKYIISEEKK